MISISAENVYEAVQKSYRAIGSAPLSDDPDIYREDTAIIILPAGYTDPDIVKSENGGLRCVFDQTALFPKHNSLKVQAEEEYWSEKLIQECFLDKIMNHLQKTPFSRSCLYNFWDNNDFTSANPKGNCITQIQLRVRNGQLEMQAHVRANDVHRCLFLDLAYLLYAHGYLASKTKFAKGEYALFVGSLHVYRKSVAEYNDQLNYINDPNSTWAQMSTGN